RFGRPTAFKIVQGVEQDPPDDPEAHRSEEHTSELQSLTTLVCRLLLEKKRAQGITAGIFRLISAWPFPEQHIRDPAGVFKACVVPGLNPGQMIHEVERHAFFFNKAAAPEPAAFTLHNPVPI